MRYLLDTNVISEPMHSRSNATVLDWLHLQTPLDLCISTLQRDCAERGIPLFNPWT